MPAFNDYTSKELEPSTRELTALLEHVYQQPIDAPLIAEAEQRRILVRARARLSTAELNPLAEQEDARPPLLLLHPVEYADIASLPAQPAHPRRKSRFSRFFDALAAVLIMSMLFAGSTFLVTRRSSGPVGGAHISTVCPSDMFDAAGGSAPDYTGLNYICAHHLYQDLNIVRVQGQSRVTLVYAYADQSQLVIWARVEQKVNGRYQSAKLLSLMVDAQTFQITDSGSSSPLPGEGLSQSRAGYGRLEILAISLPPSSLQGAAPVGKTIDVQVNNAVLANDSGRGIIPVSFHTRFTLPVAGTWHSVSLQQTQMATGPSVTRTNTGYPLTLNSVGYSLSLVTVLVNYSDMPGNWPPQLAITSFKVGKLDCADPTRFSGPGSSGSYIGQMQSFDCSLPANGIAPGSEVTLVVSLSSQPTYTWTFHFPLP